MRKITIVRKITIAVIIIIMTSYIITISSNFIKLPSSSFRFLAALLIPVDGVKLMARLGIFARFVVSVRRMSNTPVTPAVEWVVWSRGPRGSYPGRS